MEIFNEIRRLMENSIKNFHIVFFNTSLRSILFWPSRGMRNQICNLHTFSDCFYFPPMFLPNCVWMIRNIVQNLKKALKILNELTILIFAFDKTCCSADRAAAGPAGNEEGPLRHTLHYYYYDRNPTTIYFFSFFSIVCLISYDIVFVVIILRRHISGKREAQVQKRPHIVGRQT